MDLNFTKVSYDGELDEFSEEDLRELVTKFEDAQDSNVAEFETATEAITDVDEETIEDFEQAREVLVEEIVEAETFDEVPLGREALEDADFSELQDWRDFVAGTPDGGDQGDEAGEAEADGDFGQEAPIKPDEDETEDFADEAIGNIPGLGGQ
jgi:hypothetical protein